MKKSSKLGNVYRNSYDAVAGRHPFQRPWHFQWSAVCGLHKELKNMAPELNGDVLDLGCGNKPYESWLTGAVNYTGVDIEPGEKVDYVIKPDERLPFPDGTFDVVVAFEVLEHVENLEHTLKEIRRVLKSQGLIVASVPFLYQVHGAPGDFRRFTKFSAKGLFPDDIDVDWVKSLGGFGTTLSIFILAWIESSANRRKITRIAKGALLPVWIGVCFLVNMFGKALDSVDKTDSFYHHVLMVLRKK